MDTLDDTPSGQGDLAPEVRNTPAITDADRAADPFGTARLERQRDDQGRFAPKGKDEPADDGKQPGDAEPRNDGRVPKGALSAERGKRQDAESEAAALRRELAELRGQVQATQRQQPVQQLKPEEPAVPAFWENPDAATDYRVRTALDPVQQQMQRMTLDWSQRFAVQTHGQETVQQAIQGLAELRQANPAEYARLDAAATESGDPVGLVVQWHKQRKTLSEIGGDAEAWRNRERERIRQELLAEMGGEDPEPPPQPAARAPARLPSSFAGAQPGGPRGGPAYGGPKPLSEIMPRG